jgi:sialic acid synthase SpsE
MKFGAFEPGDRPLVVAEVGNNHEGRMDAARALVEGAADCGADAVKFQTFRADRFVRPSDPTRLRRLQGFELTHEQFAELARLARARGLAFLSTPLDLPSVAVLEPLVDAYKIASGDITFVPLLDAVARSGKPVILSTGASTLAEVERAVGRLRSRGAV